jgi:methyl-accepting chemotaxis protein
MKLTIGRKLVGGFMFVAVLMIIVGGMSYRSLNNLSSTFDDLVDIRVKILTNSELIQASGLQQNDYMREYFLNQNPASVQKMQSANSRIVALIDETKPLLESDLDITSFQKLSDMAKDYKKRVDSILIMPHEEALREANVSLFPLATQIVALAESMAEEQIMLMQEEKDSVQSNARNDQKTSLIISIIALAASIGVGFACSVLISRPIRRITVVAKQIAAGDLRERDLDVRTKDEIGDLAAAFQEMTIQLRSFIGKVEREAGQLAISSRMLTANAEQTSLATAQITEASQEVAIGSEQQVRGAEDSARAMEEMTQGIARIAESSASVFELTVTARGQAEEGDRAAQRAVEQMNTIYNGTEHAAADIKKLEERSAEIGSIIELITGIASQTSLLALNASIEAARAGEQGRGFMVVAAEVKKLAIQSEEAAKQISDLIREVLQDTDSVAKDMSTSMLQAKEGLVVVREAGQAFTRIREAIQLVSAQIEEVSATSEEISAGSEEVAASVEETSRIAKQSADKVHMVAATSEEQLAAMQEIASSAATLNDMAAGLQLEVTKFKM